MNDVSGILGRSAFNANWRVCKKCPLHANAREHVIGYGLSPADVLFIGEAPGRIEDILGRPFVGEAGQLFRKMIAAACDLEEVDPENWSMLIERLPFRPYVTNVVACAPWTDSSRSTWREPNKEEAEACSPRLTTIIEDVFKDWTPQHKPRSIIYVGAVAKRFHKLPKKSGIESIQIAHPASILYMNVPPESTTTYAKAVSQMRDHFAAMKYI